MRRQHESISSTSPSYDDLSTVFRKVNQQYSGRYKRLIQNFSEDGYIYILVSNDNTAGSYNFTLLVCDPINILCSYSFTGAAYPWNNRRPSGAMNKNIAVIDNNSSWRNYKARKLVFDSSNNTISSDTLTAQGKNYACTPAFCYTDPNGKIHFVCTENSSTNIPSDYNLTDNTFSRNEIGTHTGVDLIKDNFNSGNRLFIYGRQTASGVVGLSFRTQPNNTYVYNNNYTLISNEITVSGQNANIWVGQGIMVARRYNHPNQNRMYFWTSNANVANEILHNDTYTTISLSSQNSMAYYSLNFPPLFVDDDLTKFWYIDYANDTNFDIVFVQ